MSTNKKGKTRIYLSILLTIAGCVFACSSLIPNDYLKLVIVMGSLGYGLYGLMKALSQTSDPEEKAVVGPLPEEKK